MKTNAEFQAAIMVNPRDAAPKLIYAAWLEEHGRTQRAECLRLVVRWYHDRVSAPMPTDRFQDMLWALAVACPDLAMPEQPIGVKWLHDLDWLRPDWQHELVR